MGIREKLKSQSGRSMVEMLGVLAIIGVLTVGGIAGYTFAMNKYRTNEVLDGASKRAITVATQLAVETEPDLTEYTNDNDVAGGTFSAEVEDFNNGEFGLKIGNVKKAVCEGLVKTAGGKVALRAIVDQDAEDPNTNMRPEDCKDENALFLVFNNSVAAKDSTETRGSGSGSNCWATNSCGPEDAGEYDEFCDGALHRSSYCNGLEAEEVKEYEDCRRTGGSSVYCQCVDRGLSGMGASEAICRCLESGKSAGCCSCIIEGPGEEECTNTYHACP